MAVAKATVVDRVAGTASAADSTVAVDTMAAAHAGDIEAIPTLDLKGTRLADVPMVEAIVATVLADCPSSSPLDST